MLINTVVYFVSLKSFYHMTGRLSFLDDSFYFFYGSYM